MADLTHLIAEAATDFANSASMNDLEIAKAKYLGKSGLLTDALKGLGKLTAEERPAAGAAINGFSDFKNYIQSGGNFSRTSRRRVAAAE